MRAILIVTAALISAFAIAQLPAAQAGSCGDSCDAAYATCAKSCNKKNTDCFTKCLNERGTCQSKCS